MAGSVVDVDGSGVILPAELEALGELYPNGLVLGAAPSLLLNQHISRLLPALKHLPLSALFQEGSLGPSPPGYARPGGRTTLRQESKIAGKSKAKYSEWL